MAAESTSGIAAVMLALLVAGWGAREADAQGPPDASARVQQDLHGDDGVGKDGPMAHVHTALLTLSHRDRLGGRHGLRSSEQGASRTASGVAIEAVASDPASLLNDLQALGLRQGARAGRLVSGVLPVDAIREAARLPDLRTLRPSLWTTSIGSTTTQGDSALQANAARATAGTNGRGTKACVLSNSYDTAPGADTRAAADVASGDLPGVGNPNGFTTPVDVRQDMPEDSTTNVSDEGRAMLQVVHDLAPGAALGFHTAFGGQATFANGIRTLASAAGCDVVIDDVRYFAQPMFQDGIIAQAAADAVTHGTVVVSAAGNFADRSYDTAEDQTPEQGFVDSGRDGLEEPASALRGDLHDFNDTDGPPDVYQQLTVPPGEPLSLTLQWDNPFASACPATHSCAASEDLDLYLLNAAADTVLAASETANVGSDPVEVLHVINDADTAHVYTVAIARHVGSPDRFKYIVLNDKVTIDEHATHSATIYGHPNAAGVASVAAVFWFDTPAFRDMDPVLRSISSKGGTPILFDRQGRPLAAPASRRSPDFSAIDGVNNTFFGSDIRADPDDAPNFFGTSAAAPHAGALAALMRSADPSLDPAQILRSLEASALDITERFTTDRSVRRPLGPGYDRFSGAGLLQAPDAAPLPVELTAFTATQVEGAIRLSWRTASERSNAGFFVAHRPPGAAAWNERETFVAGHGTTPTPHTYHHRISDPEPGTHRFRLRQVDRDGTARRSEVRAVTVALRNAFALTATGPLPVQSTTTFRLTVRHPQPVRAAVFNPLGQRVAVVHDGRVASHDPIQLRIDGGALASGLYVLRVAGETFSATRKFVRLR
jgi:hypothetical protein